ncbi:MAG: hypothetical protein JO333_15115 [Verrucomicrobia bacterium]|nr:hypothetical protein [Verrucomicrobiota bacterium]
MRWQIVEDALRNREGHLFEYAKTFLWALPALGDNVTILADSQAETFIRNDLEALPLLLPSICHRMGDKASALVRHACAPTRLANVGDHAPLPNSERRWDAIFVPIVLVHHLPGWYFLSRFNRVCRRSKTLLFFPNLPIHLGEDGTPSWVTSPTTRLMRLLLQGLRRDIADGRTVLGVKPGP